MEFTRSSSNRQVELIRRYARLLRQETARHTGPHIGARERRMAREAAARAGLTGARPANPAS